MEGIQQNLTSDERAELDYLTTEAIDMLPESMEFEHRTLMNKVDNQGFAALTQTEKDKLDQLNNHAFSFLSANDYNRLKQLQMKAYGY